MWLVLLLLYVILVHEHEINAWGWSRRRFLNGLLSLHSHSDRRIVDPGGSRCKQVQIGASIHGCKSMCWCAEHVRLRASP